MTSKNVSSRYLRRVAVIYERVSTPKQAHESVGSLSYQKNQREHAISNGWNADSIIAIDEDLGVSGTTADRPGYQRLLAMIKDSKVGAVFVSDMTRGGRDPIAWFQLLNLLEKHDVLLFVDGRPSDPNDSAQMFVKQIEAVVASRENRMRLEAAHRGRLGKARLGKAVSAPPAGYIAKIEIVEGRIIRSGEWMKDPNPRIRASLEAVFRLFREQRSLVKLCKELIRQNIEIPSRHGNRVVLVPPTVAHLRYILGSPAYAGLYVYGRRHLRRGGTLCEEPRPDKLIGQAVEVTGHHEGYISLEEFEANQTILHLNRNHRACPSPRAALLQRRIRCAVHGYAMSVGYPGGKPAQFRCIGTNLRGGAPCITVPAHAVDRAVIPLVFKHLGPLALSDLRREWEELRRDWKEATGRTEERLRLAKERLERTRRLFLECDPDHREAKAILEKSLDDQAVEVKRLEAMNREETKEPVNPFSGRLWNELERLWSNVVTIWEAPTTTIGDRIELLRAMVSSVVVNRDRERITGHVIWEDGSKATPFEFRLPAYFHRKIWKLHVSGIAADEIARRLNTEGGQTQQGNPWTKETVLRTIGILRKKQQTITA